MPEVVSYAKMTTSLAGMASFGKTASADPLLGAVGARLRELRQRHEMTLAELSAATGISTSTLSRLESGGRKPTLELLLPLARAYDSPLDDLVGAPAPADPRVLGKPVTRHGR